MFISKKTWPTPLLLSVVVNIGREKPATRVLRRREIKTTTKGSDNNARGIIMFSTRSRKHCVSAYPDTLRTLKSVCTFSIERRIEFLKTNEKTLRLQNRRCNAQYRKERKVVKNHSKSRHQPMLLTSPCCGLWMSLSESTHRIEVTLAAHRSLLEHLRTFKQQLRASREKDDADVQSMSKIADEVAAVREVIREYSVAIDGIESRLALLLNPPQQHQRATP